MLEMPSIQWFPGHMKKTERLIQNHLSQVDVVAYLLDARIPRSSGASSLQALIQDKPHIILLNKSDLADPNQNKAWISYFENEKGVPALEVSSFEGKGLSSFEGAAERVLRPLFERRSLRGINGMQMRVMVVGIPNVGKSTFINKMAGGKRTQVENRPGVTRDKQWIRVSEKLELLDMPGVLCPKFESKITGLHLAYTGAVKDDILDIELIAIWLLKDLAERYPDSLKKCYKIEDAENKEPYDLLEELGRCRRMLIRGGEIDTERAAIVLLQEFRSGRLGHFTLESPKEEESDIIDPV